MCVMFCGFECTCESVKHAILQIDNSVVMQPSAVLDLMFHIFSFVVVSFFLRYHFLVDVTFFFTFFLPFFNVVV